MRTFVSIGAPLATGPVQAVIDAPAGTVHTYEARAAAPWGKLAPLVGALIVTVGGRPNRCTAPCDWLPPTAWEHEAVTTRLPEIAAGSPSRSPAAPSAAVSFCVGRVHPSAPASRRGRPLLGLGWRPLGVARRQARSCRRRSRPSCRARAARSRTTRQSRRAYPCAELQSSTGAASDQTARLAGTSPSATDKPAIFDKPGTSTATSSRSSELSCRMSDGLRIQILPRRVAADLSDDTGIPVRGCRS
jgi:hypothetical protein